VIRDERAESDRQLVQSIAGGSADALGALYDRYAPALFGLAYRIVGRQEDAEEVVQDVFVQTWREAPRYDGRRATVAGWLVMLTRTRAIDRRRTREARPDVEAPVEVDAVPPEEGRYADPEQSTIQNLDVRNVRAALHRLPETQRSLIDLAYYEGLSHSAIAVRTGVPLGTVKTRLRTAVAVLREALTR
jgi:RNA polymerase sigma-70 factor (ECF subfamily)